MSVGHGCPYLFRGHIHLAAADGVNLCPISGSQIFNLPVKGLVVIMIGTSGHQKHRQLHDQLRVEPLFNLIQGIRPYDEVERILPVFLTQERQGLGGVGIPPASQFKIRIQEIGSICNGQFNHMLTHLSLSNFMIFFVHRPVSMGF